MKVFYALAAAIRILPDNRLYFGAFLNQMRKFYVINVIPKSIRWIYLDRLLLTVTIGLARIVTNNRMDLNYD